MLSRAKNWKLPVKFQRRLLGISWKDKVRNEEVRQRTNSSSRREDWDGWVMYYARKTIEYRSKPCIGKWTTTSSANQEDRGKTGLISYAKTWRPLVWPSWEEAEESAANTNREDWSRGVAQCVYDTGDLSLSLITVQLPQKSVTGIQASDRKGFITDPSTVLLEALDVPLCSCNMDLSWYMEAVLAESLCMAHAWWCELNNSLTNNY